MDGSKTLKFLYYEIAISEGEFTPGEFENLRRIVEGEDLKRLQLNITALQQVRDMDKETFETAIIGMAELSEKEIKELEPSHRLLFNVVNSVKDKDDTNAELDTLLAKSKSEQDVLIKKGIKPVELTIREQIAHNKLEIYRLDEVYQKQTKALSQLFKKNKKLSSFSELNEGLLTAEQLGVLEKERAILKQKMKKAQTEYYTKFDEHGTLQNAIQTAHLESSEQLRAQKSEHQSLGNEIDTIYASLHGIELEKTRIAQAIKIQERTLRGLDDTIEIQEAPPAKEHTSMKQQIAFNIKQRELLKSIEARLAESSPELVAQQAEQLASQKLELQAQKEEASRLIKKLEKLQATLQKQEAFQEPSQGASLYEQMREANQVEDLQKQLALLQKQLTESEQAKTPENSALSLPSDQSEEIARLHAALATAREVAEAAQAASAAAHAEQIAALQLQITSSREAAESAQASLAATKKEKIELTTQLEAEQGKGNEAEIARLKGELIKNNLTLKAKTQIFSEAQKEAAAAKTASDVAHDAAIKALTDKLTAATAENSKSQKDLATAQANLAATEKEKIELTTQLEAEQGKGNEAEIARLKDELIKNNLTLKAKTQIFSEAREAAEAAQTATAAAHAALTKSEKEHEALIQNILEHPAHSTPEVRSPTAKSTSADAAIPDRVIVATGDDILQDFREIREMQRDLVLGSKRISEAPKNTEGFHEYASQHGDNIESNLSTETLQLISDTEQQKYKAIHDKYPHKNIEWNAGNAASIESGDVEICKLSSEVVQAKQTGYTLSGKKIENYRNIDVPLKSASGPMHMSLAVKDLNGKNIGEKDAVYLTAHYDKSGKLVEMTMPIPVHFTSKNKDSPVCIKKNGKIYTLPINRGKYEEMQRTIAKNKGLGQSLENTKEKTTIAQDSFSAGKKTPTAKELAKSKAEELTKFKATGQNHKSTPHGRKRSNSAPQPGGR